MGPEYPEGAPPPETPPELYHMEGGRVCTRSTAATARGRVKYGIPAT